MEPYRQALYRLEDEKRIIERRILVRDAMRKATIMMRLSPVGHVLVHGDGSAVHALTQQEYDDYRTSDAHTDAMRYMDLENQIWKLIGGRSGTGRAQVPPE